MLNLYPTNLNDSNVLCYSGSTCVIDCYGDESCYGMKVYREDGATCRLSYHTCARNPSINDVTTIDENSLMVDKNNNIEMNDEDIEKNIEKMMEREDNVKDLKKFGDSAADNSRSKQMMHDIIDSTPSVVIFVVEGCILFLAMIQLYTWSKMFLLKWMNNKDVSWINNRYQYQSI